MPSQRKVAFNPISALAVCAIALAPTTPVQAQGLYRRDPAARPLATKLLHITFALKCPQRARLNAFLNGLYDTASPTYHQWLTPQAFGERFGVTDTDINIVTAFANSHGLHLDRIWSNRLFVSCSGPVAQVERAFQIRLEGYDRPSFEVAAGKPATFFAPASRPRLSEALASRLTGIVGLSNRAAYRPPTSAFVDIPAPIRGMPRALRGAPGAPPAFSPIELSTLYNVDPLHGWGFTGQGQAVAINALSDFYPADIETFAEAFGLSTANIHVVPIDGGASDTAYATEMALEIETILGQAPDAQIYVYEDASDGSGLLDLFNQIAQDNVSVLMNGLESPEADLTMDDTDVFEPIFAQMAAQGQGHFEASGDNGAYAEPAFTTRSVNFPASSVYATAVGGTVVPSTNGGLWNAETASSTSGGGLSVFLKLPSWQSGPGVTNKFSSGYRQVPDVAAVTASPGFEIFARGRWQAGGSTGASAALWAAGDLLISQALGNRIGLLNPALYRIGATLNDPYAPFVFHDIKVGNNNTSLGPGYPATPYWDNVTGWGSADFTKLYADLGEFPKLHPFTPGVHGPGGAWTSPIAIHAGTASAREPAVFSDQITYSIGCAIANEGPADAIATSHSVTIDGAVTRFDLGPIAAGDLYYRATLKATSTKFAPGFHTITLKADADGKLPGAHGADTLFTRQIVVPTDGITLKMLSVAPDYVTGGQFATGTITLSAPAPKGGAVVALLTEDTHVTVPPGITIPTGATSATFPVRTFPVAASTTVAIHASSGVGVKSASLRLLPPSLAGIIINGMQGRQVQLGSATTTPALVTLTGPAPTGGASIRFTSNSTDLAVPASATIPAGQSFTRILVKTGQVKSTRYATLKGVYGTSIVTVLVTIVP